MTTEILEPSLVVRTESTGSDSLIGTEREAVNAVRFLAADMSSTPVQDIPALRWRLRPSAIASTRNGSVTTRPHPTGSTVIA